MNTHEWPQYIYDALMMALAMGVCSFWYDSNIKPSKGDYEMATA